MFRSGLADLWRSALLRRFGRVQLLQHPGLSWPQWRPSSDPPEISTAQVRATASGLSGQNGALVHQPFTILSASFSPCDLFVPFCTGCNLTLDISCCRNLSDTGPNAPRSVEVVKSNDFEILPFQGPNSPVICATWCRVKISLKTQGVTRCVIRCHMVSCLCHLWPK